MDVWRGRGRVATQCCSTATDQRCPDSVSCKGLHLCVCVDKKRCGKSAERVMTTQHVHVVLICCCALVRC
jgi:hypothetical protein